MEKIKKFNIRVYGLVIRENKVLLTDEFRMGIDMTKFPGGGLEYGEGPVDCLKREFREELNQKPENIRHFYTTDYFQPTYLLPEPQQLISIYYLADLPSPEKTQTREIPFDYGVKQEGAQIFRWADIKTTSQENLNFPIDRKVFGMLKNRSL